MSGVPSSIPGIFKYDREKLLSENFGERDLDRSAVRYKTISYQSPQKEKQIQIFLIIIVYKRKCIKVQSATN